jgi:hypothetical protein
MPIQRCRFKQPMTNGLPAIRAASESDQQYLLEEYFKFGEHVKKQGEESNLEMQKVLAEFENWKLEANQH